jgi:MoxR-like ATPase
MAASSNSDSGNQDIRSIEDLIARARSCGYVMDRSLATVVYLLVKLGKPLLIEGHAGVGKTEAAKVLAAILGTELIRLQCYEGLDVNSAVYEWNYQKQILAIKMREGTDRNVQDLEAHIFGPDFLLRRPLLKSISSKEASPVLLVDEIDRADEAFEAFLLEVTGEFQISIPELGTIKAEKRPHVILTSNGARELSDALKRRCLYHWIDYPTFEKEMDIVHTRLPGIGLELGAQVVHFLHSLRKMSLTKIPGVAETLDLSATLALLEKTNLDSETADQTIGCVIKSADDLVKVRETGIDNLLAHR